MRVVWAIVLVAVCGCGDDGGGGDDATTGDEAGAVEDGAPGDGDAGEAAEDGTGGDVADDGGDVTPAGGWPTPNEWSWNGSWTPAEADFPLDGLLDNEYFDGHPGRDGNPTPILPPGAWDWTDADDDLASWRNFDGNLGHFDMLRDGAGRHYGWRLAGNVPEAVEYSGPAMYFEGSAGADWLDLGPEGSIHSFGDGNMGEGPDVLVFRESWSLDFRTGSSLTGGARDDDLLVGGCGENGDGSFDYMTTTIHAGPGSDWAFVRDISRAAADLGNGEGGRTDALDPLDGDDLLVLRGNTHDFRFMGGAGDDLAVWFVDDNVQTTTWLGPNFFGGGGWDPALWGDGGTDRLVLAVPATTPIVSATPTPPGSLLVRGTSGEFIQDDPTAADPFARYCVECGTGPGGRKTLILEYVAADEHVETGYFFVTAFEELQLGVGEGARVFALDDVAGAAVPLEAAVPFVPPSWPDELCR
ncbi:MAG: hypothetical protein HY907_17085 [Deltaproteobacteria bacterium]|nr:hypothetical protein [Deltaproteobacteria bacterium]